MIINYIDREANPLQPIWGEMEIEGRAPIQADREALRPLDMGREWMILRYVAMELLSSAGDYTRDEIEEAAAICDEALNLNNFEGYELAEGYTIDALYFNVNNRVCARVLHTTDEGGEEWSYWVIY